MIVLRSVGPSLLLVLGVCEIIPSVIVDKTTVDPCQMQSARAVAQAVDIRIALNPSEMLAKVGATARGRRIDIKMVVSQTCFAVSERKKKIRIGRTEPGVGDVMEGFVRCREPGKVVERCCKVGAYPGELGGLQGKISTRVTIAKPRSVSTNVPTIHHMDHFGIHITMMII